MAMTVTATMSGTPAQEHIYLQVKVLTGATEAGGASVASLNASGGASAGGSLTPNGNSSLPVWAATADNPGTGAFSALTNNTVYASNVDADDWLYGFGFFSGTVTAGTPAAFGGSCASSDYTTWAGYEVLASAGSTPSVDASSPVLASATGAGIKAVTSASFSPPAGSVLVAMACGGGNGTSGTFSLAVTDTSGLGLTWTKRAGNTTAADQNTWIYTATVPGATAGTLPVPSKRTAGATRLRRQYAPKRRPLLNVPQPAAQAAGAAALTGTGTLGTAEVQGAGASLTGAGSLAASTSRYIAGLGGTGAGYFADQGGNPMMVLGDAAWALPGNAGRWNSGNWQADFDTFLANRAGQGFTVIYCKPIGTTQSGNLDDFGKTFDSLYPFQGGSPSTGVSGANPSSGLTSAFWARIDYMLNSALAKGVCIFLNAIGYSSDFDSGPGPLAGKSTTEFTAYGTALGTRYASQQNIVWNLADDYFSDNDSLITAFLTGLRGAGANQPVSIENMPESDSRNTFDASPTVLPWGTAHGQFNFCYSYNATYVGIEKAFAESSPICPIQGDGYFYQGSSSYAGGSGAFAFDRAIRQDAWHAVSSGARGIIHGSESTWQYQSTALASSSTDWYYKNNAGVIRTVMESLAGWQTLAPDTSSALVTAGRGTHASTFSSGGGGGQYEVAFSDAYVTASRTPDSGSGSSLAVVYLSHATTIGIDQTKMVAGYTATAYDPVSGAATPLTPGASYNTGSLGNNSKGDPDWVLVLQAPAVVTVPGTAALTGTGSLITAVTQDAPAILTGTGTLSAPAAQGAGAALTGTSALATAAAQGTTGTLLGGQGSLGTLDTTGVPAALAGAGALTAGATLSSPASLDGAGTLNTGATLSAPAALTGAGSVSTAVTQGAGTALAAAGSLGTAETQGAGTALTAAGSLGTAETQGAGAALTGTGALAAAAGQGSSLTGTGFLAPGVTQLSPAGLAAAGALITSSGQAAPAGLAGAGSLITAVTQGAGAALAAAGSLAGSGTSAGGATGLLAGTGSLAAGVTQGAGTALAAAGQLGTAAVQDVAVSLDAAGSLAAGGGLAGAAGLAGSGFLAATGLVSGASGAALAAAGTLTAAVIQRPVTVLAGTGLVAASAAQLAGAALTAAGQLTALGSQHPPQVKGDSTGYTVTEPMASSGATVRRG